MKCRNYVILALLKSRKRTVVHEKTNKAKRRLLKANIGKDLND